MLKKQISIFSLIMMNVIAVDSLRSLPLGAEYGFSLVFFYLIVGLTFFIPVSLVAAELASTWPEKGGIYVWVREAFGTRIAFVTIWLQWFYNICWYPTIMAFIAATIAYCFNPDLINNKIYMLIVITSLFWLSTIMNFLGMRISSLFSTIAALFGTLLPMFFIIALAAIWCLQGHKLQISFAAGKVFPDLSNFNNLAMIAGVVYGLVGIELSAVHANDVKDPKKNYPKAILWSGILICGSLVLSSLAIAIVVPNHSLNIISGLLQAFDIFFKAFNLNFLLPILAILISISSIGSVNAWILGPAKSLLIASQDGSLPKVFSRVNKHGVPTVILLTQGLIFTLLSTVFLLMPTVSSSFWVLSAITAILALCVYVAMFAAALRLRYKFPEKKRPFRVSNGNFILWLVCLLGFFSCGATIIIGFFPPSQMAVGSLFIYESILVIGLILGLLLPLLVYHLRPTQAKLQ